jgi:hypothetical protein
MTVHTKGRYMTAIGHRRSNTQSLLYQPGYAGFPESPRAEAGDGTLKGKIDYQIRCMDGASCV